MFQDSREPNALSPFNSGRRGAGRFVAAVLVVAMLVVTVLAITAIAALAADLPAPGPVYTKAPCRSPMTGPDSIAVPASVFAPPT
jgi:hypothetical protein